MRSGARKVALVRLPNANPKCSAFAEHRRCRARAHAAHLRANLSGTIGTLVDVTKQARRFFVSGIVQGVGFRFFVRHIAEELELAGFTRNLRDGRVEVYAIGSAEQLRQLQAMLERGSRFSSVSHVHREDAPIDRSYEGAFLIEEDD
ncbi:MAG: hypothetical protein C5B56_08155 [Proteobacteria bacterium]|nr:MAG: hypothetical protein C5B56_08155 [Pseudomonadota bacterium]